MPKIICFAAALTTMAFLSFGATADDLRQRQTEACSDDAFRLCGDFIPDEKRVEACMTAKRSQLNQKCRAFFVKTSKNGQ